MAKPVVEMGRAEYEASTELLDEQQANNMGEDRMSDPTTMISLNNNGPNARMNADSGISTATILNQESTLSDREDKMKSVQFQPIKCEICGMHFEMNTSLTKHIETEHQDLFLGENEKSVNTCYACDVDFGKRSSLRSHIFYMHTNGESVCQCGKKFLNYEKLHTHFINEHKNNALDWANLATEYENQLIEESVRMYDCLVCGYVTETIDDLHLHIEKMHDTISCKYCRDSFEEYNSLFGHFRSFHPKHQINYMITRRVTTKIQARQKLFKCICDIEFADIFLLKEHMEMKHDLNDIPYTFDGNFNSRSTRKRRGDTPKVDNFYKKPLIECNDCNKTFQSIRGLNIHKSCSHNIKTSVKCRICLRLFKNDQLLDNHVKKEHVVRRPPIPKVTKNNGSKKKKKIEQEPDKVRCPQCDRLFPSLTVLKNHKLNTHTNLANGDYVCSFCPKTFEVFEQQTNHERRMHKSQMEKTRKEKEAQFVEAIEKCQIKAKDVLNTNSSPGKKRKSPKVNSNTTAEKHQCLVCSRKFDQDEAFHEHIRHDHDTFKCRRSCNYKTGTYSSLKKHDLAVHSNATTASNSQPKCTKEKCPTCNKAFADMKNLLAHIGRYHPQVIKFEVNPKFPYDMAEILLFFICLAISFFFVVISKVFKF